MRVDELKRFVRIARENLNRGFAFEWSLLKTERRITRAQSTRVKLLIFAYIRVLLSAKCSEDPPPLDTAPSALRSKRKRVLWGP